MGATDGKERGQRHPRHKMRHIEEIGREGGLF